MATQEKLGYIVRLLGTSTYLHFDPINGDTWGEKRGAFQFHTEFAAAQFAPYYTQGKGFEITPVPTKEE